MYTKFDYNTACALLNNRPISLEQSKTFVSEAKWFFEQYERLQTRVLELNNTLANRDTEIVCLKKALLEYERDA